MALRGRRILVTGANGALGRAVIAQARAADADTIGVDLRIDEELATLPGLWRELDLNDTAATLGAFAELGEFDTLCNVAGGFAMGTSAYATANDEWEAMFRLNVDTMRNAVRASVPMMIRRGGGSIVNVGAQSAREGLPNMSAYCAAKSTVMRLTESLARELRGHGINVNAVLPSILDTPRNRADMPDADFSLWVRPIDLASVILFLGSDAARAVHGALIPVVGLS
ncbi:MAG TPA: SDR family NAD(P)-dependent oxidoreductase [Gammaproteobacteria bacterium]|nr:SDR family NAD(P)-dependent oxidoreductase [Gammaproteobacteria bacterium]